MVRLRKFLCSLLSLSSCINYASFAVEKKQTSNNFFMKTRRNRFNIGRSLSGSMLGKRQYRRVSNDFKKYGKVTSWEKAGDGVKLFFKDGKVRVVSFSLLGVLPLSVVSYLGIECLYSYLPFLEWRTRSNLSEFLHDQKRETALRYLNSIRDYLCAKNGVDPNCKFTPYEKMNEKYIFSPGYAFDYVENQKKGISRDLIVAIIGDLGDDDKIFTYSKDKYVKEYKISDFARFTLIEPRNYVVDEAKYYLGSTFVTFFERKNNIDHYCDNISSGNGVHCYFDALFDEISFRIGSTKGSIFNEKLKCQDSWFYGWDPTLLMRYNRDVDSGHYKEQTSDPVYSQMKDNFSNRHDFLYRQSHLVKGTWISYALTVYYLGASLFGSKEVFLDALGKEKNTIENKA